MLLLRSLRRLPRTLTRTTQACLVVEIRKKIVIFTDMLERLQNSDENSRTIDKASILASRTSLTWKNVHSCFCTTPVLISQD